MITRIRAKKEINIDRLSDEELKDLVVKIANKLDLELIEK